MQHNSHLELHPTVWHADLSPVVACAGEHPDLKCSNIKMNKESGTGRKKKEISKILQAYEPETGVSQNEIIFIQNLNEAKRDILIKISTGNSQFPNVKQTENCHHINFF